MEFLVRLAGFVSTAALLLSCSLLLSSGARAESFTFTASGASDGYTLSASGTLTGNVDPTNPTAYDITGVSGQVNGTSLTLVTPGTTAGNNIAVSYPTASGTAYYNYDNVVYDTGASLDLYGLLFSDGTDHANFYLQNGQYIFANDADNTGFPVTFTLVDTTSAVAATPEPSSILLLATGMCGSVLLLRRRLA